MSNLYFTTAASYGSKLRLMPRVLLAQFGEGYRQEIPDGLNNNPREWTLVFKNATSVTSSEAWAFLEARSSDRLPFFWNAPAPQARIGLYRIGASANPEIELTDWDAQSVQAIFLEDFTPYKNAQSTTTQINLVNGSLGPHPFAFGTSPAVAEGDIFYIPDDTWNPYIVAGVSIVAGIKQLTFDRAVTEPTGAVHWALATLL